MAQTTRQSRLLGLAGGSDNEDISSDSLVSFNMSTADTSQMPAKRGRGRPPANKVVKPSQAAAASTRRAPGRPPAASTKATRAALEEKSANDDVAKPKRGRKPKAKDDSSMISAIEEELSTTAAQPATKGRRGRKPKAAAGTADTSQISMADETATYVQQDDEARPAVGHELSAIAEEMEVDDLMEASPVQHAPVPAQRAARFSSVSPMKRTTERADTEASSAQLRRRIGDLSNRCESLETKYRDLREIGVKEAERNFDRFKKQSEERAKIANSLIAELREDLATHRDAGKDAQQHKQQLEASERRVVELTESLAEARKELSNLAVKLSASRSAEAATAAKVVPGSAIKGGSLAASRAAAAASTEATLLAQMKEDLYGDLTGLIVRGVKREDETDVYDCLLTGRNGTLHFKLVVENEAACDSYDEAQFTYCPQLDGNRDKELIDMLPEYLADEISFPRPHAAKFFARVTKALTE